MKHSLLKSDNNFIEPGVQCQRRLKDECKKKIIIKTGRVQNYVRSFKERGLENAPDRVHKVVRGEQSS